MEYQARYEEWLQNADEGTKAILQALSPKERKDSFYTELAFGTAGLRGILGAGTNRMNPYVVRRATAGLAQYLGTLPGAKERGVAIAYDSRRYSDAFALETALVLCRSGFRAYLFESLRAVPQLSFTVQHLGCAAGVVITASHNPAIYNGYKVYAAYGGQLGPQEADAVYSCMQQIDYFSVKPMAEEEALEKCLLIPIGKEVDEAYYCATETLLLNPALVKKHGEALRLVYTPLHGAGNKPVREMLRRIGVLNVRVVEEQQAPNGDFPTVKAPNPEDPAAFTLAQKLADEVGADIVFATDPDADRLGVAVRQKDGGFRILSGNQIGILLLHHILSSKKAQNTLPDNGLVVKSIVSTPMADVIAESYGVKLVDVLTGFRYIALYVDECARTGAHTFLYGFEESYGYLCGGFSRDKDAICAAMLLCDLCACCMERGVTLWEALQEIYITYGYYGEKVVSYTLTGIEGMEKISYAMNSLRLEPPRSISGVPILYVEDYKSRRRVFRDGMEEPLSLPGADMLRFMLSGGAWAVVRPSGTEPKLKLYVGGNGDSDSVLQEKLNAMFGELDSILKKLLALEE